MASPRRTRHQQIRATGRRVAAWVIWSPRRAATVAGAVAAALLFAFVASTSTTMSDLGGAIGGIQSAATPRPTGSVPPGLPQSVRTAWPGDPGSTSTSTAAAKLADGAEATTRAFGDAWLAGAGRPQSERDAWAATLTPYANPAMRAHIGSVEMASIPAATIVTTDTQRLGDLVTTVATLSTGRMLTIQAMAVDGVWQVSGFYVMS